MAPDASTLPTPNDAPRVNLEHLPFTTDRGVGSVASLGMIVLSTDGTVEYEFRRVLEHVPGIALFQARIENESSITPETLKAMEARIPGTARLLMPGYDLDCVGYGCTSASMVIGPERVNALIAEARGPKAATNPATAALAAFEALGMKRIALLTPYVRDVNQIMRGFFQSRGIRVPVMGSFNEGDDPTVARIDAKSIRAACEKLAAEPDVDGLFVSCTSVRLIDTVEEIEAATGKPVTSSNHALIWHTLRSAGIDTALSGLGELFRRRMA
jgi:maleate isomerase